MLKGFGLNMVLTIIFIFEVAFVGGILAERDEEKRDQYEVLGATVEQVVDVDSANEEQLKYLQDNGGYDANKLYVVSMEIDNPYDEPIELDFVPSAILGETDEGDTVICDRVTYYGDYYGYDKPYCEMIPGHTTVNVEYYLVLNEYEECNEINLYPYHETDEYVTVLMP